MNNRKLELEKNIFKRINETIKRLISIGENVTRYNYDEFFFCTGWVVADTWYDEPQAVFFKNEKDAVDYAIALRFEKKTFCRGDVLLQSMSEDFNPWRHIREQPDMSDLCA